MDLPASFHRTIREVHGARGEAWLAQLPAQIAALERRWALTLGPPFPNLAYHYVAPARRDDGSLAVVKLGVPDPGLTDQIEALRLFDGRGMVRLLQADSEQGALLLERLLPGTPLARLADDDAATAIAAEVMLQLWRPLPYEHRFDTAADRGAELSALRWRYDGGTGPLPAGLVAQAEGLFSDLLASAAPSALLHGDLHHDNILAAQRSPWLAMDPQGLAGEPAFEVGALMRNPTPQPAAVLARRADILADALGFERWRILALSLAQSVLSAWWSIEDHGRGWEGAIYVAEEVARLL
jgi:streptomycin 6-kinase